MECSKCSTTFASKDKLSRHVRARHNPNNRVTCPICNQSFARRSIKVHIQTHGDPDARREPCSQCDKSYLTPAGLRRHVREVHQGLKKERIFSCPYCDKKFTSSSSCYGHTRTHTGERPYPCPQCNRKFAHRGDLRDHLDSVHVKAGTERPHLCPEPGCNRRFLVPRLLKRHQRTTHQPRTPFTCPICAKIITTKGSLRRHIKFVHEGHEGKHACTYCDKKFPIAGALVAHIRCHTGEKPFPCSICGLRFALNGDRTSHEAAVHTEGRPHRCQHCEKAFKEARGLREHLVTHKSKEERRMFECKLCGKRFSTKSWFQSHLEGHGNKVRVVVPRLPAERCLQFALGK